MPGRVLGPGQTPGTTLVETADGRVVPVADSTAQNLFGGAENPPNPYGAGASEPVADMGIGLMLGSPRAQPINSRTSSGTATDATRAPARAPRERPAGEAAGPIDPNTLPPVQGRSVQEDEARARAMGQVPFGVGGRGLAQWKDIAGNTVVFSDGTYGQALSSSGVLMPNGQVVDPWSHSADIIDVRASGAGGGRGSGAGAGRMTMERVQKAPISEDTMTSLNTASAAQDMLMSDAVKADANVPLVEGEGQRLLSEQQSRDAQELQLFTERARTEAAQRMADIDNMVSKVPQINPNQLFESMGPGQRIGALISVALGALYQTATGAANNNAMDIINQAIDRDIESQRANQANAREGVRDKMTLYQMAAQATDDELSRTLVAKQMALESVENRVRSMISSANSDRIRTNGEAMIAQIQVQKAQNRAELEQNQYQTTIQQMLPMGGGAGAGGGQRGPGGKSVAVDFTNTEGARFSREARAIESPDAPFDIVDRTRYEEIGQRDPEGMRAITNFTTMDQDYSRLLDIAGRHPNGTISQEDVGTARALAENVLNGWARIHPSGVLQDNEAARKMRALVADPTSFRVTDGTVATLRAGQDIMRRDATNRAGAYGVRLNHPYAREQAGNRAARGSQRLSPSRQ